VDISKDALDAYSALTDAYRQFSNDTDGIRALGRWVASCGAIVVFEAAGAYHRNLEHTLSRRGLTFAKVNPRQARRFAQAIGRVAKTDKVDAKVLARIGSALQLAPTVAQPEHMTELRDLLVFRRGLIKDRIAARTQLKTAQLRYCAVCLPNAWLRSNDKP
jgi:transposase